MSDVVRRVLPVVVLLVLVPLSADEETPVAGLTFEDSAMLRSVNSAQISPDGSLVAYSLRVPRDPGVDDDGPAWAELHVHDVASGVSRPFVHGEVNVSSVRFTPDGKWITYLAKRGDDEDHALWTIPVGGGESRRILTFDGGIAAYWIAPDGKRVAFRATEPRSKALKKARKKGYKQEIFEEDWRPHQLFIVALELAEPGPERPATAEEADDDDDSEDPEPIDIEGQLVDLDWHPSGETLAVSVTPRPLVDDRYMYKAVKIVSAETGETSATVTTEGKLGKLVFSPDGKTLALLASADINDPKQGRLVVASVAGGKTLDLLPGFNGHVADFAWKETNTLLFVADVGVQSILGTVDTSGRREILAGGASAGSQKSGEIPSVEAGTVLRSVTVSNDGKRAALTGSTAAHPVELFVMDAGAPERVTDSNPWLSEVELARQEVIVWKARDGLELQGVLLHPLGGAKPAPLVLLVHGGPEAHDLNGWVTNYSRPGQVLAARGFAVLYPNYRGSTGRGVEFSKLSQADAGGKEFDDLVDAVDHLVQKGIADNDRVGIAGGSYGGYATAWASTKLTDRFKAGVMFVGISNALSKSFTTDIPEENRLVHALHQPYDRFDFNLERSPLRYAEQSRTALLIAGGTADTRVHPSQSLQLYRALKILGKTPVRYVRYPGEPHGNLKAAARDDYSRRLVRWFEHYLQGPGGDPPPWDLDPLGDDEDTDDEDDED
jgi:dipeptidyl aminopeptidase/acylaminoacyl peptidase